MVKDGKKARSGPLDASPSHLMHRALQLALDIYAEEVGADGPTQRQFAVLEIASRNEGLTQTDLVRATGIDRSTLADLVARMTAKGLLNRERSVLDGRAKAVSLSDEGRAVLESARARVEAADRRILALMPKARRSSFMKLLADLAAVADAGPDEAKAARRAEKLARKAEKEARKAAEKVQKTTARRKPARDGLDVRAA
ncbi:MarR family transcriptional regulator [Brevundimonas sp.]|uniref:MarR family winged helix-turn-helix transcriptional regulator n=1 Tax=Brevundimonas sp. TaxID=1871086 RepID=UPI001DB0D9D5|nr:MarR family transcriptional regulator [Brevundimonas sp.]MBA3999794.1 MarR family transcriptional regulator [Brevundimonas sp.]